MADSIKAQQASGQGKYVEAPPQLPCASRATPSVSQVDATGSTLKTNIPARLDRLPWSRFHLLVVLALGITWVLDGLEVTIVGAIGPVLQNAQTLGLSATQIGGAASAYVSGAVIGALVFGWLTDRHGRRLIFYVTLAVYLAGVLATATSWDALSFAAFRAITGFGIGGEYAAINSAIDELIPARYRGRIDLIVNGSFWLGAAAGSGAALLLLDPTLLGPDTGWRLSFAIGGVLGLGILLMRRHVPESPRWLVTHGHARNAEATVADIETRALAIAIFYALGTSVGATAPLLFGYLLEWDSPWPLAGGYLFAAVLMLIAALVEAKLGIDAEMRSLEDIADPLSGTRAV
jgi:MFS family permease